MKKLIFFSFLLFNLCSLAFAQQSGMPPLLQGIELKTPPQRPRVIVTEKAAKPQPVSRTASEEERMVFEFTNAERKKAGLRPVRWNDKLAEVARGHSVNMASMKFFNHRGLDGSMVNDRADAAGYTRWTKLGENIAFNRGFDDPLKFAIKQWLDSPTHKKNLLDPVWSDGAIGIAVSKDGSYYFTQVFSKE